MEANSEGWGSPLIVSLLAGSALLAVVFAGVSQRLGRWPMLAPSLLRNRQFMGASAAMTLFAVAVMGPLFLCVIAFVNMWGYTQPEAALAVAPIALMGMVVSPLGAEGRHRAAAAGRDPRDAGDGRGALLAGRPAGEPRLRSVPPPWC